MPSATPFDQNRNITVTWKAVLSRMINIWRIGIMWGEPLYDSVLYRINSWTYKDIFYF